MGQRPGGQDPSGQGPVAKAQVAKVRVAKAQWAKVWVVKVQVATARVVRVGVRTLGRPRRDLVRSKLRQPSGREVPANERPAPRLQGVSALDGCPSDEQEGLWS